MVSEMKYVGICGTFDYILHEEHRKFVEFASQFGDVIVFVTSDETVIENKGRRPYFEQFERIENVLIQLEPVCVIRLSDNANKNLMTMMHSQLSAYVFGPDQNTEFDERLRDGFLDNEIDIIDWEYTREIFTTKLLDERGYLEKLKENDENI